MPRKGGGLRFLGAQIPSDFSSAGAGEPYLTNGAAPTLASEVDITAAGPALTTARAWTFSDAVTVSGAATLNGAALLASALRLTGTISPAALGATQHDWAPVGFAGATVIRVDVNAGGTDLTGIAAGAAGRVIVLMNIDTADSLTLKHADAGSLAANQFFLPNSADVVVRKNGGVTLMYDGVSTKWRVVGSAA